jgi:hypothetical protein
MKNNTGQRLCFDAWTTVTLPNGNPFPAVGALDGPAHICLKANVDRFLRITRAVPGGAPLGSYSYNVFLGAFNPMPLVLSEDNFKFTVFKP